MRESWRLIGRDEELDFLTHTLGSTTSSGCVVSGQAGVGKTRLARELVNHARRQGREVEWFVAVQGTSQITLGALAPALGTPPPQDSAGDLLHWASQQFSKRENMILCIDDAHLLDPVSASLLLQLAARQQAFVIATVRSGTRCPDPIVSLWKDGWAEQLEVVPLSRGESTLLAQDFLGAELDPDAAERLYALSAGVPLFLRELLIAGVAGGSIVEKDDGTRTWRGPLIPTTRLTELVAARLGQLPPSHHEAMDLIALGEPLPVAVAERLAEREVLVDLEERSLLTTNDPSDMVDRTMVRIAHPLYSEVLRESLPVTTSRLLHQRLAQTATEVRNFGAAGRDTWPDEDLLRVATWRLQSADLGDPHLLVTAAELALRTFDTDLAERLGRAAVAAGAGFRADLVVADALYYANRWAEAAEALDALADGDIDDVSRAHTAIRRSRLLIWADGDPDAAHEVLVAMASEIEDTELRLEVNAARVSTLVLSNRLDEATSLVQSYISEDCTNPRARMSALPAAVAAYAIRGMTDVALDVATAAVSMIGSVDDPAPAYQGEVLASNGLAWWLAGRLKEALQLIDSMGDVVAADWSDSARGLVNFVRGKGRLEQGHATEAITITRRAIEAAESDDIYTFLPWAYNVLARSLALTGDDRAARQALADGDVHNRARVGLAEPDRLQAEAALGEASAPGEGVALCAENAAAFESSGALLYALTSLADKARFGGADDFDVETAERLADRCQGHLAPALARLVSGLITQDPELLSAVATECESIGLDLHAAEAALVAAARFDDAGRTGSALAARQLAANCLGRCGPVQTPILRTYRGEAPLAKLTKREHEIARLVGTGLTNREIAERLHVANRTVDNHVQHIFAKLDIHSRDDLQMRT